MHLDHEKLMRKIETDFIITCEQRNQIIYEKKDQLEDIEAW